MPVENDRMPYLDPVKSGKFKIFDAYAPRFASDIRFHLFETNLNSSKFTRKA